MNKAEKKKALAEAVNRILWEHWDPIGIHDSGPPDDEYSTYVPNIVRLLTEGADAIKIVDSLGYIERSSITLTTTSEHRSRVARILLDEYSKLTRRGG